MLVNENVGSPVVSAPGLILRHSRNIEGAQGRFVIRSVVVGGHVRNMEPGVGGRKGGQPCSGLRWE